MHGSANCDNRHWQPPQSTFLWLLLERNGEKRKERKKKRNDDTAPIVGASDGFYRFFSFLISYACRRTHNCFFPFVLLCLVHRVHSAKNVCVESSLIHEQVESILVFYHRCGMKDPANDDDDDDNGGSGDNIHFHDWWWYFAQKNAIFAINFSLVHGEESICECTMLWLN